MAGIGPVSKKNQFVERRAERQTALTDSANELEIFYNLCIGRVHFKSSSNTLYFVDSVSVPVSAIIHRVFKGFSQTPTIKQRYLDKHNLIKAAFCIQLTDVQFKPVLVALRLRGIHIEIT
ncbi:MAG: Unknown protein [uncultured Thiotrichaceae bacterium]|uniref:Uncharacterized protein n=1 Tax=uncultured Thiotrichaceae bacterium TaxID=298394 RepID=A0A6S6UCL5_9GAMM|nr:MAG: Unknown protein [uncultured Thiotrichaceae bacterium]